MDVEAMTAGRELDCAIDAAIFGYSPARRAELFTDDAGEWRYRDSGMLARLDTLPPYSTDIAVTWAVVEEVRRARAGVEDLLFWRFEDCCTRGWQVEILEEHYNGPWLRAVATALTLPLAICRAALIVKEANKVTNNAAE